MHAQEKGERGFGPYAPPPPDLQLILESFDYGTANSITKWLICQCSAVSNTWNLFVYRSEESAVN